MKDARYRIQQRVQSRLYKYVQRAKGSHLKEVKDYVMTTSGQIEHTNKEIKIIKQNEKDTSDLKSKITKMKNSLEGLNSRFEL